MSVKSKFLFIITAYQKAKVSCGDRGWDEKIES
jgi:hypothetical protein